MTRRHPLQALRRTTEHESNRLRPRLAALDTEIARCSEALAGAQQRLVDCLRDADHAAREGQALRPGAMMMWRHHARSLHREQASLAQQLDALQERRRELEQSLSDALVALKSIDLHHDQLTRQWRLEDDRRHQTMVDELWAARRGLPKETP